MEELAALAITCVYMDELGPALTPTDVMKPWSLNMTITMFSASWRT